MGIWRFSANLLHLLLFTINGFGFHERVPVYPGLPDQIRGAEMWLVERTQYNQVGTIETGGETPHDCAARFPPPGPSAVSARSSTSPRRN